MAVTTAAGLRRIEGALVETDPVGPERRSPVTRLDMRFAPARFAR